MANSFGDQLLKAGLVSKDKLNKAKKSKYRQQKTEKKKPGNIVNEATESARRLAAEKAERDRELNRRQKEALERKAIQAQVRQLVELNRLPRDDGEIGYNFQDGTAIKKLFVSNEIHDRLGRGLLAIVRFDDGYEVIPSVVAEKIKLRDASCIVSNAAPREDSGDDDPYADYKVPDDLMW
ncbi:MAG TPA: DUF2058 domain-containing protein [Gammaproteobacteria bacterium]|nr:DUF2058 domain-containing protein [Gammaproteobacteria bacterium]